MINLLNTKLPTWFLLLPLIFGLIMLTPTIKEIRFLFGLTEAIAEFKIAEIEKEKKSCQEYLNWLAQKKNNGKSRTEGESDQPGDIINYSNGTYGVVVSNKYN